jgi:hypothetical protein
MCLAVEVRGPFSDLERLDGLIGLPGGAALHGGETSSRPISLPVQFAAILPGDVAGSLSVQIVAVRGGAAVAYGAAPVDVPPSRQRVVIDLKLIVRGGDLGTAEDLAQAPILADLAGVDRSAVDAGSAGDGSSCSSVVCTTPPAPTCVGAKTLRRFASPGSCDNGACSYGHVDTDCAGTCVNGACVGGPCQAGQCMDRQCGVVAELGCDCGGCPAATWCDIYCGETACESNRCCLPAGSSCDPSQDWLFKTCCPGTYCLNGRCGT